MVLIKQDLVSLLQPRCKHHTEALNMSSHCAIGLNTISSHYLFRSFFIISTAFVLFGLSSKGRATAASHRARVDVCTGHAQLRYQTL